MSDVFGMTPRAFLKFSCEKQTFFSALVIYKFHKAGGVCSRLKVKVQYSLLHVL